MADGVAGTGRVDVDPGQEVLGANHGVFQGQLQIQAGPATNLRFHAVGSDDDAGYHIHAAGTAQEVAAPDRDPLHLTVLQQQPRDGGLDPHLCPRPGRPFGQNPVEDAPFQDIAPSTAGAQGVCRAVGHSRDLGLVHLGGDPAGVRLDKWDQLLVAYPFSAAHRRADLLALFQQQDREPSLGGHICCRRAPRPRADYHHVIAAPEAFLGPSHLSARQVQRAQRTGRDAIATLDAVVVDDQACFC